MNIRQAKEQIKYAMKAYFSKDEFGSYVLPTEKQRPVFLLGAPGIGKTAIIEQIAQELDVAFVSYSMTHHTRQSALGLPFIAHKTYDGMEFEVSEYTMSEIIASVYDMMEFSGKSEGILFLDEINCVSETLTPAMLQFLQYKVFGRHRVPEGWIVVTAGNPPEYNRTVHDFDIATWDRLKRVDVEPDYDAWHAYAVSTHVHPSIISYLEIERDHFYHVETTIDGVSFVTARSWDDLSSMIKLSEQNGLPVNDLLIGQYIQDAGIAKRFAVYYDLFTKYRSDYQVDEILNGTADEMLIDRAKRAAFDERVSLVGLLSDALCTRLRDAMMREGGISCVHRNLASIKEAQGESAADIASELESRAADLAAQLKREKQSGLLTAEKYAAWEYAIGFYSTILQSRSGNDAVSFNGVRAAFEQEVASLQNTVEEAKQSLEHAFAFADRAFSDGQEMVVLVTDLAANKHALAFIEEHGSDAYFTHSARLDFNVRESDLAARIGTLNLDDPSIPTSNHEG